jgi:hypothetical protein
VDNNRRGRKENVHDRARKCILWYNAYKAGRIESEEFDITSAINAIAVQSHSIEVFVGSNLLDG